MPSIDRGMRRRGWRSLGALLLSLLPVPLAMAFNPASTPLLGAAAVAPNVMLVLDDSLGMNSIVHAREFDPLLARAAVWRCAGVGGECARGERLAGQAIALSSLGESGCRAGFHSFHDPERGVRCLKLPDPVGAGNTLYSADYLSWLLAQAKGRERDFTDGSIPNDYRMNVARRLATALVTRYRWLRLGVATFNSPAPGDPGPGGYIARPISDLSAIEGAVSPAQAEANYQALLATINGLKAGGHTPLAETYYEITRYLRGMVPYYNLSPALYSSPIQYRCQKNYGVVISAGAADHDTQFPLNDPLGAGRLPNWDGIGNDGSERDGQTLFLDDLAKFAFDIDLRGPGVDEAGKSWAAVDFPRQYLNTFTVGFQAHNPLLMGAADYGQGEYFQARSNLERVLAGVLGEGVASAVTAGSGVLDAASGRYYQSQYDPVDWHGTIRAYGIDNQGRVAVGSPLWSSDSGVDGAGAAVIHETWNTASRRPVSLAYGNLSTAQRGELEQSLPAGVSGAELLGWSQGRSVSGLRERRYQLGDIVNSPLVLATAGQRSAVDGAAGGDYSRYLAQKATAMATRLLVNSNDGLFNVLDPASGERLYGYMPSSALGALAQVADPGYRRGERHRYLVDGPLAVFDGQRGGAWQTLALGGVGAGGKSFFAVRLFDAVHGNTPGALWEIGAPLEPDRNHPFNDLGYAYARPQVARLADGRWAAFIGNGYGSHSGVAALYVVDLNDGSLIREIAIDDQPDNGLSSVTLKVNARNEVQAAYAGDLKGRLWKFELSGNDNASWHLAFAGQPLFRTAGGASQPISAPPRLLDHPRGGQLVLFGTGKLNETRDKQSRARQGFYGVWDAEGGPGGIGESQLQVQHLEAGFSAAAGSFLRSTLNEVRYPAQRGWYLPLVQGGLAAGERVLNEATLVAGRVVFSTLQLEPDDPCSSAGSGKLIELEAFSGKMLDAAVLDTNGDGVVDDQDQPSSGVRYVGTVPSLGGVASNGARKIISDSRGGISTLVERPGGGSRRILWRQIQ
ncbi:pilus assembly protein [Pseudomonas protegens]|uniref:pilus assembly protein n=1 Tax=Pseudomonas protegens TaxID=380021 RepID=UPI003FD84269